jgi:hypothetical protein
MEKQTLNKLDKKITIPKVVKRILENSLLGLDFATDIILPSTLEYFTPYAIMEIGRKRDNESGNYPKTSINLHIENSDNFTAINGALYTKDMKTLLYMPNKIKGGIVPISNEAEIIGEGSCSYINGAYPDFAIKATIPKSVKKICKNVS